MTIRVYKGQLVSVLQKTSHGITHVNNIELVPDVLHPTEKWKFVGEPYEVKTNDVRPRKKGVPPLATIVAATSAILGAEEGVA